MMSAVLLVFLLVSLQAAALLAGPAALAPVAAAATLFFLARRRSRRRVLSGTLFFAAFFLSLVLMGFAESLLRWSIPDHGRFALLSLRGFASFLVVLAATEMFTLAEVLVFLKRVRVPGYILTIIYLMVQDLSVLNRLAAETGRTIRARGAGLGLRSRIGLTIHAAKSYLVFAALKFRHRHEHIEARGLTLDLPFDDWRARERLPRGA